MHLIVDQTVRQLHYNTKMGRLKRPNFAGQFVPFPEPKNETVKTTMMPIGAPFSDMNAIWSFNRRRRLAHFFSYCSNLRFRFRRSETHHRFSTFFLLQMGVVIESEVWEPGSSSFVFIFVSCFLSLFLYPHFSRNESSTSLASLDHGSSRSLARFRNKFLFIYSLASGWWS